MKSATLMFPLPPPGLNDNSLGGWGGNSRAPALLDTRRRSLTHEAQGTPGLTPYLTKSCWRDRGGRRRPTGHWAGPRRARHTPWCAPHARSPLPGISSHGYIRPTWKSLLEIARRLAAGSCTTSTSYSDVVVPAPLTLTSKGRGCDKRLIIASPSRLNNVSIVN